MNMANQIVVDVGKDFGRFPAGRTVRDGDYSGSAFRDRFLLPPLKRHEHILVKLDTAYAYGSSFLEEAFGGLVRLGVAKALIRELLDLATSDDALRQEIEHYVNQAEPGGSGAPQ